MARIRTIKPEFWTSEQVMECSTTARLLFIGMLNFCDDGGNHPASAKRLKAQVFPSDDITTADIEKMVSELVSTGLISEYSAEDRDYWHVTGWHHQKIEKPTYKHPAFKTPQAVADKSASSRRVIGDASPPEGKGSGREVVNQNQEASASTIPSSITPAEAVCARLLKSGIKGVNPTNPKFLVLLSAGIPVSEFCDLAEEPRARGKSMGWILGAVEGRRRDAASAGTIPVVVKEWHETASGIEAKAVELGIKKRFDESFPSFKVRVFDAAGLSIGVAA